MAETFVDSIDHGLRHNLIYAMADADDPQLLSATLAFALHGRPAACPTAITSSLQHSCGSDFGGVFAAVARRKPDVALEFLRANWAEAGSVSRLNLVAEVNLPQSGCKSPRLLPATLPSTRDADLTHCLRSSAILCMFSQSYAIATSGSPAQPRCKRMQSQRWRVRWAWTVRQRNRRPVRTWRGATPMARRCVTGYARRWQASETNTQWLYER